ncbi:hypothetical protein EDF58_1245 [Novosphingobium sp. PhB57]|nr:hypothetical protein EDF58_1245 [Novosphingobium sp. PhB57]
MAASWISLEAQEHGGSLHRQSTQLRHLGQRFRQFQLAGVYVGKFLEIMLPRGFAAFGRRAKGL